MADKYTYTSENKLIKEGAYECFIEKIVLGTTKNGTENISINLRVRSDIEQECKNRVIYDTIWKEKENPEFFDRRKINRLLGTQKVAEGTTYSSVDEIIDFLKGKTLCVNLGVRFSDYKGADENYVKFYTSTKVVEQTFTTNESVDITEDELPF